MVIWGRVQGCAVILAMLLVGQMPSEAADSGVASPVTLKPVSFQALNGWADDITGDAFAAFLRSCARIGSSAPVTRPGKPGQNALRPLCGLANALGPEPSETDVRSFFQTHFTPHEIIAASSKLTAYYEPVLPGALEQSKAYPHPLYRRPADGPLPTRAEIEAGALDNKGLELVYLADPVDVFFVHVQGSTRITLPDGKTMRVGYGGKNGHPYRSVGRAMLKAGVLSRDEATAEAMKDWLRANPVRARRFMNLNSSYVFFRIVKALDADTGPIGGEGVPLTPGRSLAIDHSLFDYGLPFWIEAALPTGEDGGPEPFRRLMIAQDTGSAITGPARGDVFWGSGADAGIIAGRINNPARFVVFLPRAPAR